MSLTISPTRPVEYDELNRSAGRRGRRVRLVASDPTITPDEVRAALQRVLASPDFPATMRNRRFLAFITEKTLAGLAEELNGYQVATEVFKRPADFNPTADPIVRIEAGKLRRDLEIYYLKSGAGEEVRISLPRGGYIPAFQRCPREEVRGSARPLDPHGITVHALHSNQCALAQAEPAFRAQVADRLARHPDVAVFAGPVCHSDGGLVDSETVREIGRSNGTRFILSGDAQGVDGSVVFTARLHDGATGQLLWSEDIASHPALLGEAVVGRVLEVRRALAERLDGRFESSVLPS